MSPLSICRAADPQRTERKRLQIAAAATETGIGTALRSPACRVVSVDKRLRSFLLRRCALSAGCARMQ